MHRDQLEIRLLGPTLVRRRDGSPVAPKEWRTTKSLELVRLLAVAQDAVPVDVALDRLWPSTPTKKAQASLRTATYHVRSVLGEDAVERRSDGLALRDAWVDAHAYALLADEIGAAYRSGNYLHVAALSREAEALYVHDLETDGAGDWLVSAQETWRELRLQVLLFASEAAVTLERMREALDLATAALAIDSSSERAVRVLMRAFGALGEIEEALTAYERLRQGLGDKLGVDPSPQTRALHLQLLSSTAASEDDLLSADAVVGHEDAVDAVAAVLTHLLGAGTGGTEPGVLWVLGDRGSGKSAVIRAAGLRAGVTPRSARLPASQLTAGLPRHAWDPECGGVLVAEARSALTPVDVTELRAWACATSTILVVSADEMTTDVLATALGDVAMPIAPVVHVEALDRRSVVRLLSALLQGAPAPGLVDLVLDRTGGRSGDICAMVREWMRGGRVLWTPEGMTLSLELDKAFSFPRTTGGVLKSLGALDFPAIEALVVLAVLGGSGSVEDVDVVLRRMRPKHPMDAQHLLDRLVDGGLLRVASQRYSMRNEEDRTEVLTWLRPATLEHVHDAVSHELVGDSSGRIRYLTESGQHRLARDVAVDAVARACQEGDLERARELLEVLDTLSGVTDEYVYAEQLGPEPEAAPSRGRLASFGATASRWAVGLEVVLGAYSPLSLAAHVPLVA